jgi:hypothetical protein
VRANEQQHDHPVRLHGHDEGCRAQAFNGVRTALTVCAPDLDDNLADDVAAVVLNNMKTMAGMANKEAPSSLGAPDELRLMNRLYLKAKLGTRSPRARKKLGH